MFISALGLTNDTWTALNTIASIFSSLATLGAVIVALHLANREKITRVVVQAKLENEYYRTTKGHGGTLCLFVRLVSNGYLPVTVTQILWRVRGSSTCIVEQDVPIDDNVRLPFEMRHGVPVVLKQQYTGLDFRLKFVIDAIRASKNSLKSVEIGIETATGKQFFGPINAHLRESLLYIADPSELDKALEKTEESENL